jgi:hypothetical protein
VNKVRKMTPKRGIDIDRKSFEFVIEKTIKN